MREDGRISDDEKEFQNERGKIRCNGTVACVQGRLDVYATVQSHESNSGVLYKQGIDESAPFMKI